MEIREIITALTFLFKTKLLYDFFILINVFDINVKSSIK